MTDDFEKAGKRTLRGKRMSSAQRRAIATDKITPRSRITRSGGAYVLPGWGRKGNLSDHVVRKDDAIEDLDAAIEKARGLLPKGGSSKLARRMDDRASRAYSRQFGDGTGKQQKDMKRAGEAATYLRERKGPNSTGFSRTRAGWARRSPLYKAIDDLDTAIEKAGLRINGGVRVSPKQRRTIAMESRGGGDYQNRGAPRSQHKLSPAAAFLRPKRASSGDDMNSKRRMFTRAKQGVYAGSKKYSRDHVQRTRREIDASRAKQGKPSLYRRTMFRGLQVKKADIEAAIAKAKPKTLYIYREVENAADIIAWAQSQGFKSTQPGEKMHVTLAFSKTEMNWAQLHDDWHLEPLGWGTEACACDGLISRTGDGGGKRRKIVGGIREVKALGNDGAIVLAFESDSLTRRHMDIKAAGAEWKFPSFTPHITLTYQGKGVDLSKVLPYAGDIVLGEECWEEVNPNGQAEAIASEINVGKALDALDARLAAIEAAKAEAA